MLRYIPNILSFLRICMIPIFIYVFFSASSNHLAVALFIFVISGITDLVDGYLARRYNWITAIGTALDPLADKLMMLTVLACLVFENLVPFFVLVIILINEASMILMALYIYFGKEKTVVPANKVGKLATALFFGALVLILMGANTYLAFGVLMLAVGMKLIAFIGYGLHYFKTIRHL